ncbi:hypothetical protein MesoLj113a_64320 [Mesorhizobium sp. 113-1-2]|nr:hypothetical protein MesoLj113a_64320 [Mesorhizobium sp. 113-1-2]
MWAPGLSMRLSAPSSKCRVPPRCSDDAYKALIARIMEFYTTALFNPHWGEQIVFRPGNLLAINMLFQGIDQEQAEVAWRPFLDC